MQNNYITKKLTAKEINQKYNNDKEIINMSLYNTTNKNDIKNINNTNLTNIKKELIKLNKKLIRKQIPIKKRLIILNNFAINKTEFINNKPKCIIKDNKIYLNRFIVLKKET